MIEIAAFIVGRTIDRRWAKHKRSCRIASGCEKYHMRITARCENEETPLPTFLQVEPVGQCNLRCEMCSVQFRKKGPPDGPPAFMGLSLFKDLIDQFEGAKEVQLQGLGEPLLHPAFFEMVSYCVTRGLIVSTNSNLTVFNNSRAEECVRSGLSWMCISVDGASATTYEAIRKGSRFRLVLQNIELLHAAKDRLGSATPRDLLVMVLMKKNLHELNDIIRLARRLSIEQVYVQGLCHDFSEEGLPLDYRPIRDFVAAQSLRGINKAWLKHRFEEARALASELNIVLRLPATEPRSHALGTPGRIKCEWPWHSVYISYDGKAMPCCIVGTPDRINFGSMTRYGVSRIWNGKAYEDFRSSLDSDNPPAICRSCSSYRGTF